MKKRADLPRKLLCILLTILLVAGMMPAAARTAYAEETRTAAKPADSGQYESSDNVVLEAPEQVDAEGILSSTKTGDSEQHQGSDIFALESQEPEQLDAYPEDVYGKGKNRPFLLSEQNELALIITDPEVPNLNVGVYDNFDLDMKSRTNNESFIYAPSSPNAGSVSTIARDPYVGMDCIQSIGFDRDGTGKKQYIASVGIKDNRLKLVVQNASSGVSDTFDVEDVSEISAAPYWVRDNYLAITAGDYDKDGKDSVIIYVCGKWDVENEEDRGYIGLAELTFDKNGKGTLSHTNESLVTDLIPFSLRTSMRESADYKYKPAVTLATGDFNGDGRDQLALSVAWYNPSEDIRDGFNSNVGIVYGLEGYIMSRVAICDRTSSGWTSAGSFEMYNLSADYSQTGSQQTYGVTMMHGASIAAGDVNNDGVDDIVAAGYVSLTQDDSETAYARIIFDNEEPYMVQHIGDFCRYKLVSSVISMTRNGYAKTPLKEFDMPQALSYTFAKYCDDKDWVFPRIAVACGKTNGNNNPAVVFIGGVLYNFKDLTPEELFAPSYIASNDLEKVAGGSADSSVNWIRNVAAGNFNGNDAGREQFVFTFWQKVSSTHEYYSTIGVYGGVKFGDKTNSTTGEIEAYGPPTYYAGSLQASYLTGAYYNDIYYGSDPELSCLIHKGAASSSKPNAVPVAVDSDDDGLIGRFNKSGYVYTDPQIVAVLQAGPYFKEIEDAGGYQDPCETVYEISTGYGNGTSRSDKTSFEVGISAEVQAGPVRSSLEAGYSMDWSHTYETSYTVEKIHKFAAQSETVVALHRVPELVYTYDIWNKSTKKWIVNGMNVRVPLTPRYYTLTIDKYNEFVNEYNKVVGSNSDNALVAIKMGTDLPDNHEGNPDCYWSSYTAAGNGGTKLSDDDYSLSYGSGYMASEYSVTQEKKESEEVSHGFHFGLTMQGGGDFLVGEAWAGAYANMDFGSSTGTSKTTLNTETSGGKVQNIRASAVEGLSAGEVEESFGFGWNFIKWERKLARYGGMTPFYGYAVFNCVRRAFPPQINDYTSTKTVGYSAYSVSSLTSGLKSVLTVTKVSGNSKITYDSGSKSIKVAAGLTAGTYNAKFKISNGLASLDKTFNFKVVVKGVGPTITTEPQDVSVPIDGTVKLTTAASGSNLTYQWQYRNSSSDSWKNSTMACAKTNTFTFTAAESHSGHQYRCGVSNGQGTTYTRTATVTVRPKITTQPTSKVTVAEGGTVKLTVAAKGTNLKYQWQYRNSSTDTWKNSTMACAKTNTFTFTAAINHSGHQYRCGVSNGKGTTYTNTSTVTVTPKITKQPSTSVTVALGNTVKLVTAATGTNVTYQWQYRNSSSDTWKNSTMACAKTTTFSFTAAESHSGHQYRCAISNGKGTAYTNTTTVTVTPKITTQPKDVLLAIDSTVKLTVAANGTNLTYQWQYRNSSTDSWKNSTMACAKTAIFSFKAAESHSGHQYRCLISNGKGTAYSNAATVTVRPLITTQPKDTTVSKGATVKLTVAAKGTNLTYKWQYRNSSTDSWKNSTMACAKTNTFSFTAAASHSGHQYRCAVSNGKGTTYTKEATVTVK